MPELKNASLLRLRGPSLSLHAHNCGWPLLLQINETRLGWIPSVPRPLAVAPDRMKPCCSTHPPPPASPPTPPPPPPPNLLRPRRTAALKSTIRQQSAPTKPAFSHCAVATRCPADPPGWSWQDGGLREHRGRGLMARWLRSALRDSERSRTRSYSSRLVRDPAYVALKHSM